MNGMKTSKLIMAALVAAALAGVVVGVSGCNEKALSKNSEKASILSSGQAVKYTCPMHPEVVKDAPGNCPKCGMALVEKR